MYIDIETFKIPVEKNYMIKDTILYFVFRKTAGWWAYANILNCNHS